MSPKKQRRSQSPGRSWGGAGRAASYAHPAGAERPAQQRCPGLSEGSGSAVCVLVKQDLQVQNSTCSHVSLCLKHWVQCGRLAAGVVPTAPHPDVVHEAKTPSDWKECAQSCPKILQSALTHHPSPTSSSLCYLRSSLCKAQPRQALHTWGSVHVAAVLSKSPSRRGTAPRRLSFAARSPKGSAGGSVPKSPRATARGPGLVPAAVPLSPRGPAAVSGSTLVAPPSPLSRRQSMAVGSLTRMSGAAAGAQSGTQGLQQGLLGMPPISDEQTASQVGQYGTTGA